MAPNAAGWSAATAATAGPPTRGSRRGIVVASSGGSGCRSPASPKPRCGAILQASGSAKQIAAQVGRSHPTVLAVLSGKWHADKAPDLPRRSTRSCLDCGHWSGRCGLGFPDPEIEGPAFGADCPSWCDGV